jgi:hypothetical protein
MLARGILASTFLLVGPVSAAEEPVTVDPGNYHRVNEAPAMASVPDGSILLFYDGPVDLDKLKNPLYMRRSVDGGFSWGPERTIARVEGRGLHCPVTVTTSEGNLHIFFNMYKGWDTDDFQLCDSQMGQTISTDGGHTWTKPERVDTGERYHGSCRNVIQLANGRIVLPFCFFIQEKMFRVGVVYSDDQGKTWTNSPSILDVGRDDKGKTFETGATEPVVIQLKDGRVWMLLRSTTGVQWESFSSDNAATWTKPVPSRFISSNCPASLLRLRDDRIVLIWNNSYTHLYSREVLNIAVSADEGKTWKGYREIVRLKPHEGPDWKLCYPYPVEDWDGNILVAYWEFLPRDFVHARHRSFVVRVDPEWMDEVTLRENFERGLSRASVTGSSGVRTLRDPGGDVTSALSLQRMSSEAEAGAVLNFPLLERGELSLKVRCNADSSGLLLFLKDSFMKPKDPGNGSFAVRMSLEGGLRAGAGAGSRGSDLGKLKGSLQKERWHSLRIRWDTQEKRASVFLDGHAAGEFEGSPAVTGICYLGLYAAADSPEKGSVWITDLRTAPAGF